MDLEAAALAELDAGFDVTPPKPNAGIHVQFYLHTDRDEKRSREEGRPCFKDYEYLRCIIAGDRGTIMERPVTAQDKWRYAEQYARFSARQEQIEPGYPLKEWTEISRAEAEELRYFKIHTVEQLAALTDGNAQNMRGMLALREKAKAFLARLEAAAPQEKLQAELAERDSKIAVLEQNLAVLVEEMKARKKER